MYNMKIMDNNEVMERWAKIKIKYHSLMNNDSHESTVMNL